LNIFYLFLPDNDGQIPPSAETKDIFGIMGIIHLLAGMNFKKTSTNIGLPVFRPQVAHIKAFMITL
jgi:hypothetical protein